MNHMDMLETCENISFKMNAQVECRIRVNRDINNNLLKP